MTTAVVVATVVTTNLNEIACKDRLLKQIRRNDRHLRAQLAREDHHANVVTAILNMDEFMEYVQEWLQQQEKDEKLDTLEGTPTTVITDGMDEFQFMDHTLQQLRSGEAKPTLRLDAKMLEAMDHEEPGEDFSRYPFRY